MENGGEKQDNKSYASLTNVKLETQNNYQFKFEDLILSGNSDSEEDNEEISMCSDDSRSEEEISICEDSIQGPSNSSQNFTLTTEDWSVINSCHHPELKKLLMMNRNVKYMTLQLFNKIKGHLVKNQEKMKALKKSLEKNESKECHIMYIGQLGAPYFKTKKDMFSCDPNRDTLDRKNRGLLTIYQTTSSSKWSKSECDNLTRGVQLNYNHNKQKALLKEITASNEKLDNEDEDSESRCQIVDKIGRLENEVRNLKALGINDIPPLSQDTFIDWEHVSTEFLMDKHNAQECSSFWHIYLHPDINKSSWTSEENKNIRLLAEKYNNQDWDRIASELGTNRSGFSVFLYFSSTLCDQFPKSRFTEEEDRKIVQYVESRKIGSYVPWNVISEFFPSRTKLQVMHRYKYYLRDLDQFTQGFSDAEDILIMLLVERFGRNYMKFTKYLPTKSYMQIKSRYDNHLRFSRIKGSFTLEEDKKILSHFNENSEIGSLTVALNRNRLQIRQRYRKLKAFFDKHPEESLENVTRRCGKKNETFRRLEFLKCIGDQFKKCVDVPTINEIEMKLGRKTQSKSGHDIDKLLVNFFTTSYTFKQKSLEITTPKITNAAEKIYNILKSWRVNLKIPVEIKKNDTFDIIDCEILNFLRNKYQSDIHTPSIDDLLPPNLNSLIGLRGLLLKNQLFKKFKFRRTLTSNYNLPPIRNNHDQIACELSNIFQNKDISTQCVIQNERSLFLERFISMFMWPALLSIESPGENITKLESTLKNSKQPINKKKDVNKCKNKPIKRSILENSNNPVTKKRKLNDGHQQNKCDPNKSIQPQRFSSRLKIKKEISNETKEVELLAVERTQNTSNVNESNPKKSNQIIKMAKSTNVKIFGNTETIPNSLNKIRPQNLPPNLVKVDKREIVKLLQNKKTIKIFKIQSINKPDCTKTVTKPQNIDNAERLENIDNLITSQASGSVPLIENIKNNLKAKLSTGSKNTNNDNSVVIDSNKIKKDLNNPVKKNTEGGSFSSRKDVIHSTSTKRVSESSTNSVEFNHTEDLKKLDAFLNSVRNEDCSINLTENEVMKNEVDQLIKQESNFNPTSF